MKPAHPEETSGFRSFNLHRPPAEKICTGVTSPRQGDLDVGYPIDIRGQANRLQQFSSQPVRFITTYSSVNLEFRQTTRQGLHRGPRRFRVDSSGSWVWGVNKLVDQGQRGFIESSSDNQRLGTGSRPGVSGLSGWAAGAKGISI